MSGIRVSDKAAERFQPVIALLQLCCFEEAYSGAAVLWYTQEEHECDRHPRVAVFFGGTEVRVAYVTYPERHERGWTYDRRFLDCDAALHAVKQAIQITGASI